MTRYNDVRASRPLRIAAYRLCKMTDVSRKILNDAIWSLANFLGLNCPTVLTNNLTDRDQHYLVLVYNRLTGDCLSKLNNLALFSLVIFYENDQLFP